MPARHPIVTRHSQLIRCRSTHLVLQTRATTLRLGGRLSQIQLGGGVLSVACPSSETYSVQYIQTNSTYVNMQFFGVPPHCIDVPTSIPCVAHSDIVPPLFWCVFEGISGFAFVGPYRATSTQYATFGLSTSNLACAYPPRVKWDEITSSDVSTANVTVLFGQPGDGYVELPYSGPLGNNSIAMPATASG